ncbi:hypothetical protein CYMTET_12898 [Cymbomonas tetramitiformis]|uniref:Equilibrative nucleoside transporter n=1 Tax=Cymbomonas tetramitiformis TaxID=36881 RepID=A0AAE0GJI8_9CHLO|nr:hypothetical protein CYMTET_12898 [Cymbomonas tetramitiformis]|eukprot:gene9556-11320_t
MTAPPNAFIYANFVLFGTANLILYNAFITACDYYASLFGSTFEYYVAAVLIITNTLGMIYLVYGHHCTDKLALGTSVNCAQDLDTLNVANAVLLAISICIPFVKSAPAVLLLAGACGWFNAIQQSRLNEISSRCHSSHVSALQTGLGLSGVLVGLLRIACKLAFPDAKFLSAVAFFALSALITLLALVAYLMLFKPSEYIRRHTGMPPVDKSFLENDSISYLSDSLLESAVEKSNSDQDAPLVSQTREAASPKSHEDVGFALLWRPIVGVGLNFLVTLTLFPGLTSQLESNEFGLRHGWWPVLLITEFNVGDMLGKWVTSLDRCRPYFPSVARLPLWAIARLIFFPLFLGIAIDWGESADGVMAVLGTLFRSDYFVLAVMLVFSFSNGFLGSVCMVLAPEIAVQQGQDPGAAGICMVFYLMFGLSLGSICGIGLGQLHVERM